MQVKFITTKGSERLGRSPFYVGLVQHERTMSRRETYEHCEKMSGLSPQDYASVDCRLQTQRPHLAHPPRKSALSTRPQ